MFSIWKNGKYIIVKRTMSMNSIKKNQIFYSPGRRLSSFILNGRIIQLHYSPRENKILR